MRLATSLLIVALAAAILGGCGGSSDDGTGSGTAPESEAGTSTAPAGAAARSCGDEARFGEVRATGLSCLEARRLAGAWAARGGACRPTGGASHAACTIAAYRCIANEVGKGLSVSCARSGASLAFIARRGT
jgi:hypothetical protein